MGELILRHSDNLSQTLQKSDISAAEGQADTDMTVKIFQTMRNDPSFDLFWGKVTKAAEKLELSEPQLPRRRIVPKRFEDTLADTPTPPQVYYIYFEAIDLITTCNTAVHN